MSIIPSTVDFGDVRYTPFDNEELVRWWRQIQFRVSSARKPIREILDASYTKDIPPNKTMRISDPELKVSFLEEALDYFAKGTLSLYATHVMLRENNRTWALVATYYSSFYTVNCLLRIQGRAIVHSRRGGDLYWLCPSNTSGTDYLIVNRRERRGEHVNYWELFYNLYFRYRPPSAVFEPITRADSISSDEREEVAIRNSVTYYPFSFEETRPNWAPISESFWEVVRALDDDLDTNLSGLCTHPDHKYYARAGLRLRLAKILLEMITDRTKPLEPLGPALRHLHRMKDLLNLSSELRNHSIAGSLVKGLEAYQNG